MFKKHIYEHEQAVIKAAKNNVSEPREGERNVYWT